MSKIKYYFNLFKDNETNNIIYEEQKVIKTNLTFFNLKFYLDEITDLPINDCILIIEKEIDGKYSFNNSAYGTIGNLIEFKNIEFKNPIEEESKYRIYFEFKQGGITILSTKRNPLYFVLHTKPTSFNIDIQNSILLDDIYELQSTEQDKIKFNLSVNSNNILSYSFKISHKELVEPGVYIPIINNKLTELEDTLSQDMFKNGFTYLHFFLKDNFDNTNYRKYKITTKNNTFTSLFILNNEFKIKTLEEPITIFYEHRNVTTLKPVIQYEENNILKQKEGTNIGTFNNTKRSFSLNLKTIVQDIPVKEFKLFFVLNDKKELVSNECFVKLDNVIPEITLKDYFLVSDEKVDSIKINGKIKDDNLFYIGENVKVIKPINKILLIQSDKKLSKIKFDGMESIDLEKYNNYYTTPAIEKTFELFDNEKNKVTSGFKYINSDSRRHFYIWLDKNKLTLFEKNILENHELLKVKEEQTNILEQQTLEFNNLILIKVVLNSNAQDLFEFDLGVDGFDYSFLKYVNNSNISGDLDKDKKLILSFDKTNLIFSKNENTVLIKTDSKKVISEKVGIFDGNLNILGVSYKTEKFILKTNSLFFDNELNKNTPENIYFIPKLKKGNKNFNFNYYICKRISKDIYNFEMEIPINEGLENYKLIFEDELENKIEKEFKIEKNFKKVEASLVNIENYNLYKDNNVYNIVTRNDDVTINFEILNETKEIKETESNIVAKSNDIIKYQKVKPNNRTFSFNFKVSPDKKIYEIYHEGINEKICDLTIQKKNELLLECPTKITTGLNSYNLYIKKDEFSRITVNYSNPNFNIITKNNYIEINRTNNLNIIEELDFELNVVDDNNIYQSVSKNIKANFYNDNIIEEYKILNSKNNIIKNNSFDLEIKLNNFKDIEFIRVFDEYENVLKNKLKYGTINNYICTIKGITTPINPNSIKLEFKIKNTDIIVKQELFTDNKISLFDENKNFKSSIKYTDTIEVNINTEILNEYKIKLYNGNELLVEKNIEHKYESIKVLKEDLRTFDFVILEIYNNENKLVYYERKLLNIIPIIETKESLNFDELNILQLNEASNIILNNKENGYEYVLEIEDENGIVNKINLQEGLNTYNSFNRGSYKLSLIKKRFNFKKVIKTYYLNLFNDINERLEYSKGYTKFNLVNSINIINRSNIDFKNLEPNLVHITETKKHIIVPQYNSNGNISFRFKKESGLNRFIYKDKVGEIEFENANYIPKETISKVSIDDINTNNESLFYIKSEREVVLESESNVYFTCTEADKIIIKPDKLNNEIERFVYSEVPVTIYKEFVPCKIDFYKNDEKIDSLRIDIEKLNKTVIQFWNTGNKRMVSIIPFKIKSTQTTRNAIQLSIKNRVKHFLYNFTIITAKVNNKKDFLTWTLDEQEEFIKDCTAKYYDKFKDTNVEKIKDFIRDEIIKLED